MGHSRGKDSKRFFGPCHISIVEFRVNELQRSANELGSAYAELQYADQILVSRTLLHSTYASTPERNVDAAEKALSACPIVPC